MSYFLAALLLIAPLIFIHELGHLIAAKMVGVKVLRFSIGFGKPFARFRMGETEYALAPIPLGGYVRLLGQHPGEHIPAADADRALDAKPLLARAFVMAAGPLANLVLPLALLFFFHLGTTMTTPAVVGTVFTDTAADAAGMHAGDRIISVDGEDIGSFRELQRAIAPHPDEELRVEIERDGKRFDRFITPRRSMSRDALGVPRPVGMLGVGPYAYTPQIGIVDVNSPAYGAGLRTGDIITSVRGEPLERAEDLEQFYTLDTASRLHVTFLRPRRVKGPAATFLIYETRDASLVPRAEGHGASGILPAVTFIQSVEADSPAAGAGIKSGDRIVSVDGKPAERWDVVESTFARADFDPVSLEVQSPGEEPRTVELAQVLRKIKTVYRADREYAWHGMHPFASVRSPTPEPIHGRVSYAARASWDQCTEAAGLIIAVLRRILALEEGLDGFQSVFGVGYMAGVAAERGIGEFIELIALFSINLAIFNLLPIPILDGGHLLFYAIEAVRRRPIGQRAREIASAVGLLIILLLLLIGFRNDIMRLWFD